MVLEWGLLMCAGKMTKATFVMRLVEEGEWSMRKYWPSL